MTDLDRLADYRPTQPDEWTAERRASARAGLFDDLSTSGRLRFRPRHRFPATAAAAAAVVALIGGILVAVDSGHGGSADRNTGAGGVPWSPPTGLSDQPDVGPGQWAYTVTTEQQATNGNATASQAGSGAAPQPSAGADNMTLRDYHSPDGVVISIRSGAQTGCRTYPRGGDPSLDFPTADFLATLPTDVDALTQYLGSHVQGSSSHDEAIFVSVGDLLRGQSALASPKLRAAMLAVLSRLPEVTLHTGDQDALERPAIRADFVDQKIRPGEVHAYYFDASNFSLVEERYSSNGEPNSYSGPSPAYSGARANGGVDPAQLGDGGYLSITRSQTVVDELPAEAQHCPNG